MKRYILTIILAIATLLCSAQNDRIVRGKVFDAEGEPVPEATLKVAGTNLQFVAGADGTFSFSVPYYVKMIEASKLGYLTQSVEIDGAYLVFNLKEDKKLTAAKAKAEEAALNARLEKERADREAKAKEAEAKAKAEAAAQKEAAAREFALREARRLEAEAKAKAEAEAQKEAAAKAKAEEEARIAAIKKAKQDSLAAIKKAKQDSLAAIKAAVKAERKAVADAYNAKYRNKGLVHNFELNYSYDLIGLNQVVYENYGVRNFNSLHPLELTYAIGYRFCNWVSLNLGGGICYEAIDLTQYGDRFATQYYDNEVADIAGYTNMLFPAFLNTKLYLSRGENQPIISVTGGAYILPTTATAFFDVGFGYNIRCDKRSNLYVMASLASYPSLYAKVKGDNFYAGRFASLTPRIKIGFTF